MVIHLNIQKKNFSVRSDAFKNRNKIKDSAIILFKEKGLEVTIEEIAEHAKVGVGTIYRNIGNKQELANQIAYEVLDEVYTKQLEIIESGLPVEEKLHQIFSTYLYLTSEYGEIHQMVIVLLNSPIEPNQLKDDWLQKLQNLYKKLIKLGQVEGIFSPENTYVQEQILINTVNPRLVKEIATVLPLEEAALALSKFVLNGLIIKK